MSVLCFGCSHTETVGSACKRGLAAFLSKQWLMSHAVALFVFTQYSSEGISIGWSLNFANVVITLHVLHAMHCMNFIFKSNTKKCTYTSIHRLNCFFPLAYMFRSQPPCRTQHSIWQRVLNNFKHISFWTNLETKRCTQKCMMCQHRFICGLLHVLKMVSLWPKQ